MMKFFPKDLVNYVSFVMLFALLSILTSTLVFYLYPRVAERIQGITLPKRGQLKINKENNCRTDKIYILEDKEFRVVKNSGRQIISQDFTEIADLSTLIEVKTEGALDFDLRLEAMHRGDGYSEAIGFGTYVTYQYSKSRASIDAAPVVMPEGWSSGINIRDLRDHYGQNFVVNSLGVKPGFYKFCIYASAHSYLTPRNDLAEIIVDGKFGRRNVLRLAFHPHAVVLH